MKIATTEMMRKIDNYCIEEIKIPSIILMENAALKILKHVKLEQCTRYTIVCGKGNNGGDGFAVARHLFILGKTVEVFLMGNSEVLSDDCRKNYIILKNLGVKVNRINNMEDITDLREAIVQSEVTIDAIFGTGIKRKMEQIYEVVVSIINENSKYILSIDIPSGLNGNTGETFGTCVKGNKTVCLQLYKKGFLNYGTDQYTGEIVVEDIGIPKAAIEKFHNKEIIADKEMIINALVGRDKYSYKGDYGRALLIAGSKGYSGAAYISTEAAVRSGAGLVTLCCHSDIQEVVSQKLEEAMTITFKEGNKLGELIKKSNGIGIGPGMGATEATLQLVKEVILEANCPLVIDADGINVLRGELPILKKRKGSIIITPHLGEMSKITDFSIEYIRQNRMEVAKKFAEEHEIIVVLKGYHTIITDGKVTLVNSTGNSAMASGGMGDCLTGMIVSLLAQGYEPMKAATIATYIHGYCGEELSKKMFSVNATHILEKLPFIMKEFEGELQK